MELDRHDGKSGTVRLNSCIQTQPLEEISRPGHPFPRHASVGLGRPLVQVQVASAAHTGAKQPQTHAGLTAQGYARPSTKHVVVAGKPKRSPFKKLAYATIALLVFNLPFLLYPMYAEPVHDPFAGLGQALLVLICFAPHCSCRWWFGGLLPLSPWWSWFDEKCGKVVYPTMSGN
jgi:hypothetical protein